MAQYDLVIDKGATLSRTFQWRDSTGAPVNLAGYTARMQVRKTLLAPTPDLDLTTENGGITLGGADGTIMLYASDAVTAAVTSASGVYDIELVSGGGFVTRLLEGQVVFTPEVTR